MRHVKLNGCCARIKVFVCVSINQGGNCHPILEQKMNLQNELININSTLLPEHIVFRFNRLKKMYSSVRHSGTTWKREKIYLATGTKHTYRQQHSCEQHLIEKRRNYVLERTDSTPKDDTMTAHSFAESMLQCLRWRNGDIKYVSYILTFSS